MSKRQTKEINGVLYAMCTGCLQYKEMTEQFFSKQKGSYMGLRTLCKICAKKQFKQYRDTHKDEQIERVKKRRKEHIDECREKGRISSKKYRETHKEHYLEYGRKYREKHKEQYKEYMNKYIQEHRSKIREQRLKRQIEMGYREIHNKTGREIRKLGIRPKKCPLCNKDTRIFAHHPDYNKRNEIVFCCQSCHKLIHSGKLTCPQPINVLDYNK